MLFRLQLSRRDDVIELLNSRFALFIEIPLRFLSFLNLNYRKIRIFVEIRRMNVFNSCNTRYKNNSRVKNFRRFRNNLINNR